MNRKPIGFWKCVKSNFKEFKVGELYECREDNVSSPRIYSSVTPGTWAPYWAEQGQRFCYPRHELDFEYVGPLTGKRPVVLTVECEGRQPDMVVVNGITYITGTIND